jgi:hypothetical protein
MNIAARSFKPLAGSNPAAGRSNPECLNPQYQFYGKFKFCNEKTICE